MSTGAAKKVTFKTDASTKSEESAVKGANAWERVRLRLQAELGEEVFNSWFARVSLEDVSAGIVQLSAPTLFLKGWIKSHYNDRLLQLWQEEIASVRRVDVAQRSALRVVPAPAEKVSAAPIRSDQSGFAEPNGDRFAGSPLDPRLSFNNFCEGRSNDVACRAARAAARSAGGRRSQRRPPAARSASAKSENRLRAG